MRIVDIDPVIRDLTAMKTVMGFDALLIDAMIEGLESQPVICASDVLRDQWVSVKDRVQEMEEIVNKNSEDEFSLSGPVFAFGNNGLEIAMMERDENHEIFVNGDGNIVSGVTHWMPLPEPPEEDKP